MGYFNESLFWYLVDAEEIGGGHHPLEGREGMPDKDPREGEEPDAVHAAEVVRGGGRGRSRVQQLARVRVRAETDQQVLQQGALVA